MNLIYVSYLSVHCSLVVTCWEGADLLALLYVMFFLCFFTFSCVVLGQVWYLILSISDLTLLTQFTVILPCNDSIGCYKMSH